MSTPSRPLVIAAFNPVETEYFQRVLQGAIQFASETPGVRLVENPYMRMVRPPQIEIPFPFDGAIAHLSTVDTWVRDLLDADVPVVSTSGDWWTRGPMGVAFDGASMIRRSVEYLVELGRPNFAYVGECLAEDHVRMSQLRQFDTLISKAGYSLLIHDLGRVSEIEDRLIRLPEEAAGALREFLTGLKRPASILCSDDYVARVVCDEAQAAGFSVPDDFAILGNGDNSVSRLGQIGISSVPQPGELIGRVAMERLIGVLNGNEPLENHTLPCPPVIERESTGGGILGDQRFRRIREWIHERACQGLTVNELVDELPMSQFTFSKKFAALYGRTPGEEIRHVKTETAKRLLRGTEHTVEEIAYRCGFEQQGKFSKFFKRQTGITPSAYRAGDRPITPADD